MPTAIAVAGRRIDAPGAPQRFPLGNRAMVGARIAERLRGLDAALVVGSGACGVDLLAHDAARALGVRSRIVLPFDRSRFRETSVVDRPGDWGPLYDLLCDAAARRGDLVELPGAPAQEGAFVAANEALLDDAVANAARASPAAAVLALVVWDGPRGAGDVTEDFLRRATQRGLRVATLSTL
jgi:hypothetical protein